MLLVYAAADAWLAEQISSSDKSLTLVGDINLPPITALSLFKITEGSREHVDIKIQRHEKNMDWVRGEMGLVF